MKQFWAPITVIALAVSGCAQDVQTRVSSAGLPDAAAGAFMISTTETMSAELRQAYPLVTRHWHQRVTASPMKHRFTCKSPSIPAMQLCRLAAQLG